MKEPLAHVQRAWRAARVQKRLKNKQIYKGAKRLENGRWQTADVQRLEDQQMCQEIGEQQMCKKLKDWLVCKEIEEQENVQRCKEQSKWQTADVQRARRTVANVQRDWNCKSMFA